MKDKILNKATELFISLGFKSVTMDDIASSIGASKKTLYNYYPTKTALVKSVTDYLFDIICTGIDEIHNHEKNPVTELFEVKRFVMMHLKNEKSSPQFQLQKYYPKIFKGLQQKQFDVMQEYFLDNLKKGIDLGLYRKDIDIEFVSRIYLSGVNVIKDHNVFPKELFNNEKLMDDFLEYHLRGICTQKGTQFIENS